MCHNHVLYICVTSLSLMSHDLSYLLPACIAKTLSESSLCFLLYIHSTFIHFARAYHHDGRTAPAGAVAGGRGNAYPS